MSKLKYKIRLQGSDGQEYVQSMDAFLKEYVKPLIPRRENFAPFYRFNLLKQDVDFINEVLVEFFKRAIKERLLKLMPSDKSVRAVAFMYDLNIPIDYYAIYENSLSELIEIGLVQDRGSGWYRKIEQG